MDRTSVSRGIFIVIIGHVVTFRRLSLGAVFDRHGPAVSGRSGRFQVQNFKNPSSGRGHETNRLTAVLRIRRVATDHDQPRVLHEERDRPVRSYLATPMFWRQSPSSIARPGTPGSVASHRRNDIISRDFFNTSPI